MIRVNEIKLTLNESQKDLRCKIAKRLKVTENEILNYHIVRESIDARDQIMISYSVDVELACEICTKHLKNVSTSTSIQYEYPKKGNRQEEGEIVIVGFGPSGMYASLLLAQMGYAPYVVEQGEAVEQRVQSVENFFKKGILNPRSNVQFGEGGAGTFSDGKLTTRSKDHRSHKVLEELIRYGAHNSIAYEAYPHIGTDRLRNIVKRMREDIITMGGSVHFCKKLTDLRIKNHKISEVCIDGEWIRCKALVLAVGHSARDTFLLLNQHQIAMEAKSFAVGVRIEHPQSFIDVSQYKESVGHPKLGRASYRLTHTTKKGRGVYSFCMCPGGCVVASSSNPNGLVVNGMSEYARDKENANSAILVQVTPNDFGKGLFDGMYFQEQLEKKAFILGGSNYFAPAQYVHDYLKISMPDCKKVQPSYQPGVHFCDLHELFPAFINEALEEGLHAFDNKIKGFIQRYNAVLTGVESRSSSPVRIIRDKEQLHSVSCTNLYPCGEGAGYAGGIVSAAIDGLKIAEKIIQIHAPKYEFM